MKNKVTLCAALFFLTATTIYSQSGQKWATGGNGLGAGDFFGSTNNFPVIFKTNNLQRASISATGVFQLNNLAGSGNRFIMTDANGNLIPFNLNGFQKLYNKSDPDLFNFVIRQTFSTRSIIIYDVIISNKIAIYIKKEEDIQTFKVLVLIYLFI